MKRAHVDCVKYVGDAQDVRDVDDVCYVDEICRKKMEHFLKKNICRNFWEKTCFHPYFFRWVILDLDARLCIGKKRVALFAFLQTVFACAV